MSKAFKHWLWMSVLSTILSEIIIYFMVMPEYRLDPMHRSIMWLLLPLPTVLNAMMIPAYRKINS